MHHKFGWRHGHHAQGHHGHCGGFAAWEGRHEEHEESIGGGQGVRRPLRFLVRGLGLDERQVPEIARILDELKIERAQADVDRRRTMAAFADAVASDTFDAAKAGEGGDLRVKSEERLREAVLKALQQIHALLTPEQRGRMAYLIRTGTLSM